MTSNSEFNKWFEEIAGTAYHVPADGAYKVNTTKYHTAINASFEARTHLVGIL